MKNKEVGDNDLETWKTAENDVLAEESNREKTRKNPLIGENFRQDEKLNCKKI